MSNAESIGQEKELYKEERIIENFKQAECLFI